MAFEMTKLVGGDKFVPWSPWSPWRKKFAWIPFRVSGQWVWRDYYYERDHIVTRDVQRGNILDVLKGA